MAKKYLAGDVVLCKFPYQDDPTKYKIRPGLILSVEMNGTTPYFHVAKITTTTSISDRIVGITVSKNSKEGKAMRIESDSFVNLEHVARLPLFAIMRIYGTCPLMTEINKMCSDNGIPF